MGPARLYHDDGKLGEELRVIEWCVCRPRVVVGVLCNADSCIGAHPCTVSVVAMKFSCNNASTAS